jgi:hypothetical protein
VGLAILAWTAVWAVGRGGAWIALGCLLGVTALVGFIIESLRAYAYWKEFSAAVREHS